MNFLSIANLVMQFIPVIFQAMATIQADTGKPWDVVVVDLVKHLTAGQENAPALSPTAKPLANPSDHPINGQPN